MKSIIKIVIDTKDTRKMCSDKKKLSEGCATCFSEIQELVSNFLADIEDKDAKQRARMGDEWAMFLNSSEGKLDASIKHSEKEASERNTNSRWVLTIVLGITFALGAVVGITWDRMNKKAERSEVITINEYKFLHDLTKAYNANQFIQNPDAKVDSTNYELIVNAVLGGAMRGGK